MAENRHTKGQSEMPKSGKDSVKANTTEQEIKDGKAAEHGIMPTYHHIENQVSIPRGYADNEKAGTAETGIMVEYHLLSKDLLHQVNEQNEETGPSKKKVIAGTHLRYYKRLECQGGENRETTGPTKKWCMAGTHPEERRTSMPSFREMFSASLIFDVQTPFKF